MKTQSTFLPPQKNRLKPFNSKALTGLAIGLITTTTALSAQAFNVTSTSTGGPYTVPIIDTLDIPITVTDTGTISSFNSVTISNLQYLFSDYRDIKATLSNGSVSAILFCNTFDAGCSTFTDGSLDLNGNYTFADTGSNWYTQTM